MTKDYEQRLIQYAEELKEMLDSEGHDFKMTELSSFLYRLVGYIESLKEVELDPKISNALREEFLIHFKNSPGEFKFLEDFIDEYRRGFNSALKELKIKEEGRYL